MNSQVVRSSYRATLRELRKGCAKDKRSASIASSFRSLFATPRRGEAPENISREASNLVVFLRAQREYDELLKRYNPLHDLSPEDHRLATAHRVGLNMPKDFSGEA
ncbi:hypothetical protein M407DRAFT_242351 [Tulasnella calospora MUT 4182]|uniref:Uncharacterized protein n=1 Tax=Tulasnella calospora MUT 4182 TaxID=1051891 RepID=A0A0C3QQT1_9AGAM|nr:hypothetical protein M407DRAFT_242351 [Tulasnella calospora MUT 4182]